MYITNSILAALLLYPLSVLSSPQATGTGVLSPQQTIVPFGTLPSCAQLCGPLFDAQGACSPPSVPQTDLNCFCSYPTLQPFRTTTAGVCDAACPNDPNGLTGIKNWFVGLCSKSNSQTTGTGSSPTSTATSTGTATPVSSDGGSDVSGDTWNGPWINSHWQWVVMIVVLSLAIIIGWVGACLLRRRYIRRKEREYELRPPAAPWVPGQTHPGAPGASPYGDGVVRPKGKSRDAAGMFMTRPPNAAGMSETGPKKWVVKERT